MNIKITKEEYYFLLGRCGSNKSFIYGSKLYGTDNENSDTDIMIIYEKESYIHEYYPIYHTMQYDDIENNIQYLVTSQRQFFHNLLSGDSSVNVDIILNNYIRDDYDWKLNILRTYNIIKSFLGFAKRDLKTPYRKNKLFHIQRSLYCAFELIAGRLPKIEKFSEFYNEFIPYDNTSFTTDEIIRSKIIAMKSLEQSLRSRLNELYNQNEITLFPKEPISDFNPLEQKIISSLNNKNCC